MKRVLNATKMNHMEIENTKSLMEMGMLIQKLSKGRRKYRVKLLIITKNGNFTESTYIFQTRDFEMGTNPKLKKFSKDVDIIWICGFYPTTISFKHIDLSTITMASRFKDDFPNLEYKECTRFYHTNSIVNAKRCNKDVTFLLGSLFSKNSLRGIKIDQMHKMTRIFLIKIML